MGGRVAAGVARVWWRVVKSEIVRLWCVGGRSEVVVVRAAASHNGRPVVCEATNGLASPVSTSLTLHVLREYSSPYTLTPTLRL
ncbi:hypothetical protein E2C01_094029 [Portunus trituberculatus]|uniref:Uncharacterized protein n=1 Tax=Portunus trituberculatus TaxID=210409 RepID=A0A5B7JKN3_PORTR|nr:hypothetical protein [Portunus trituberculatus]